MKMVDPMKKWTVSYNGEMVHQATGQKLNVSLEVEFLNFPINDVCISINFYSWFRCCPDNIQISFVILG